MNFNALRKQLGMSAEKSDRDNLTLLTQWVQENLSQDSQVSGTEQEQLTSYQSLIEAYWATNPDSNTVSPLPNEHLIFTAASLGLDRVISALKLTPAQLAIKNKAGMSPLHLAAVKGHVNTTEALLALGATGSALNNQGQYPIFSALMLPIASNETLKKNKITIFNLLLKEENQITLQHKDDSGNTIMQQLALHDFSPLLNDILASHSELAFINNNLTHYPIHTAILNNQLPNIKLLLALDNGPMLADRNGWAALHYAARKSTPEILDYCCQATPDIDIPDTTGRTPLMLAADLGNLPAMEQLIEHGAKVNSVDQHGLTVLHHAVDSGNKNVVRLLLKNPAVDINAEDNKGKTPLRRSELNHYDAITALLSEETNHPSTLRS